MIENRYRRVRASIQSDYGDTVVYCTNCGRLAIGEQGEDFSLTTCVDCGNNEWKVLPFTKGSEVKQDPNEPDIAKASRQGVTPRRLPRSASAEREKSLSQLKRDAKTGNLEMRMVYRYGSSIPERMQGWREVVGSNSAGIKFKSNDGKFSLLDIESANLAVYTDNSLTIYGPGLRDLTAEEQRVMDEWQEIASTPEYTKQSDIDALTDGSQTYWQQKKFFRNKNMEYLMGTKRERGMKLEFARSKNESPKIRDYKVRGDVLIKYEIRDKGKKKYSVEASAAVNCNTFEIMAKESGANFHNISKTKKDGVTYMKFVSSAPEAEQERVVNWLRRVLEGQEGSGVLSWGMRGTSRGEMSVMIKDADISHNDAIKGTVEASMMNDNKAYVIFNENGKWKGTSEENYNARIRNARAITTFEGMRTKEEVIEYMNKYMSKYVGGMNNVRIIENEE